MNAVSMSVMNRSASGGADLDRRSLVRSEEDGAAGCVHTPIGDGTWMMALPGRLCLHGREGLCED